MDEKRLYEIDPKGHEWEKDEDGSVNIFATSDGNHNGPRCVKCDYGFCHHCREMPDQECDGGARQNQAKAFT